MSGVSERRSCQVLGVSRARLHRPAAVRGQRQRIDPPWTDRLRQLIQQHPTFGYRRLWVLLRFRDGNTVNRKAVYRILHQKRWCVHQRASTPRPRVRGWTSRASRSDERWAMDVTHIPCGHDGWAHLAAVIDCHDRELIGYELALRSRAQEAERAVEAACLQRFGTLRPIEAPTPYTPEQSGMIERFFRSLKEECVWQHTFQTFEEARRIIRDWVEWYNQERPHQALGYRSPVQYRAQHATQVA